MNIINVIRNEEQLHWRQMLKCVWSLSIPAMLSQITYIVMEYIDAAMVGSLGAAASAAIGLVAPVMWFVYGIGMAAVQGFSVQVAQFIGAKKLQYSRDTFRQGLICVSVFAVLVAGIGVFISPYLPGWLGATPEIYVGAYDYFMVYMLGMPIVMLRILATAMLQSSGSMKSASFFNCIMCVLDIGFNALFIFPAGYVALLGLDVWWPGLGFGVKGAAMGTVTAEGVTACILLYLAVMRRHYTRQKMGMQWHLTQSCLKDALKISCPIALEQGVLTGAMIAMMIIVAPLGTVAIAANSFAITAEAFCYMPGYGIAIAATTLVGQSIGAKKPAFARGFAWFSVGTGMFTMGILGAVMYMVAPAVFAFLTPDLNVQQLGTDVLRIQLLAESLFAASIVGAGALRGARDTMFSSIMNLASMWGVRMPLALYLVGLYGLRGVWTAMCLEVCVRGLLFLVRIYKQKWDNRGSME
ncbi:Na+-driven multidrug efflux pump [Anaerovibrio sp. JC8]|uniref:MATE family efflux transporter n=1 Tax=Anaerovibrio sp. JC8 TaxID=1240085 RepID=UPI000A0B8C6C|nr:MATE family efflux transporter [Anaerovibrio sp. JC8]ORU00678.1 Na+-driven multidrug efflux pump [Anaerovibrio sp. JC8]